MAPEGGYHVHGKLHGKPAAANGAAGEGEGVADDVAGAGIG